MMLHFLDSDMFSEENSGTATVPKEIEGKRCAIGNLVCINVDGDK